MTPIGPVVALDGTVAVNEVVVAAVTATVTPLNDTTLFAGVKPSKFVPEMVTDVPTGPMVGLKLDIVGIGTVTVNAGVLVVSPAGVPTLIFPLTAALGTVTVNVVAVTAVGVALISMMPFASEK